MKVTIGLRYYWKMLGMAITQSEVSRKFLEVSKDTFCGERDGEAPELVGHQKPVVVVMD